MKLMGMNQGWGALSLPTEIIAYLVMIVPTGAFYNYRFPTANRTMPRRSLMASGPGGG